MILLFPDLDTLRVALTSGIVPAEVTLAPARPELLLNQLTGDPARVLCNIIGQTPASPVCGQLQSALKAPRTAALDRSRPTPARVAEPVDRTLGGLVEVQR